MLCLLTTLLNFLFTEQEDGQLTITHAFAVLYRTHFSTSIVNWHSLDIRDFHEGIYMRDVFFSAVCQLLMVSGLLWEVKWAYTYIMLLFVKVLCR
jgi:hypothetical protein